MGKFVTFIFIVLLFQSTIFSQTKVVIPAARDNTIYEYYDTDQQYFRSNGSGDYFFAGVNGAEGGNRIVRGLLQFDLPKFIPDGVEILEVTLTLNMNQTNSGPQTVSIYPLLQDWGEGASDASLGEGIGAQAQTGDATWLHTFYNPRIPDDPNTLWTEKGGDFNQTASASVIVDQPDVYSWGSTESMINDVQAWVKDPKSNFGWILRGDESGELTAKRFISRSNPDGNGPELVVTYDFPNTPPVAVNDTTETSEDQPVQISVSKNDYDTDGTLDISSIALSKNPVHGKADINNEIITYTPESNYSGTDSFEYTIKDNDGAMSNSAIVMITVNSENDAPVVTDIPNQTINEGQNFVTVNLDNYVSDVDNADAEMIWSYSGNISLSVTIVNRAATIAVPNVEWNGSETITFTATDPAGLFDSDAAIFTVNAINDAPIVADIPGQTITEGSGFTTINLDGYVSDADNSDAEMTWTVTGQSELIVSIVNRVATISLPDVNWYGAETITFTATDPGNLSDSDGATFTVTNVNDAPVVSNIPNQTINEGQTFTTISLDNYVTDIDNADSQINWTYSGNTALTVAIVNRVATISTPGADWNGAETITFTATDPGNLTANDAATFTVNAVNDAPVVSDIPNQSIAEGGSFAAISLDSYVNDVDDSDAGINWTYSGNTDLIVSIVNRVATIEIPNSNWNGSEIITFTATDPGNLTDSDAAAFTVSAQNDPPVVGDIPDQTIEEGSSFTTISLDNFVTDADNNDTEINWTYNGNTNLTVSIVNRVATISLPNADWNGHETITFTAADPGQLANSDTARFTVSGVNDAPVVSDIPDQTIDEGNVFAKINLDNYVTDVDNAASDINWTYSGNSELTVSIDGDRVATITIPSEDWNSYETITFTATDPGALADSDSARFTVTNVNDAPVLSALPALSFKEDELLKSAISDWYTFVEDKDNPDSSLTYTLSNGKSVMVAVNGDNFDVTAPQDWFGKDTMQLKVSDGALADSGFIVVTVQPVNDAPQLADLPPTVMMNDTSSFVLDVNDFVHDVDTPPDKLSWQFSADNDSLLLDFDETTSRLTISALAIDSDVQVVITVTDDSAASASDTITVRVTLVSALDEFLTLIPAKYSLDQNYPNPFNPATKMRFGLPKAGNVKVEIYSITGQRVATVVNGFKAAGFHVVSFDASHLASGLYFYRIQAKNFVQVKKMILMK